MPTIYTAADDGQTILVCNPDSGAQVGRWCKAPWVPDLCDVCYDPETLAHYPATGYVEDAEGWRYGTCERCHDRRQEEAQAMGDNGGTAKRGAVVSFRGARFPLGQVEGTPGAIEAMEEAGQDPAQLLGRHVAGDWGDVCEDDANENEFSVERDLRILSVYTLETGVKVWVITEADRSATTFLLPSEY